MLDDLRQAGHHLLPRQGAQAVGVGQDQPRLVEGAHQVLAEAEVDRRLAADAGVDLGDDRRRHLHHVDAAQVAGGHEAGQVADDAPADGGDPGAAVEAGARHARGQLLHRGQVLALLAGGVGEDEDLEAGVAQAAAGLLHEALRQGRVPDEGAGGPEPQAPAALTEGADGAVTDDDLVVPPARQPDGDLLHEARSSRRRARPPATSSAEVCSEVRTVMSAAP